MDFGRVVCVLVANRGGHVLYERFYIKCTEAEKAEVRAGLQSTIRPWLGLTPEDGDRVGRYKAGVVACTAVSDIIIYTLGTGEYEEMTLSYLLSAIIRGLQESLKVPLNERNLIDKYSKMLLVIDEAVNEGIIDQTNPTKVVAGTKLDMRSK